MHRVTGIVSRIIFAMLTLSLAALVAAKSEFVPASVGEVSLVLGRATVSDVAGNSVPVSVGLSIHVGDTIETASSGHVHIRFVDNELVSVRPLSMLEVVRYDYNPQNPQNSAVILNVEGVSRAISGQAAKEARQNFRMNTPIAAIGVRGTDFVVSADSQSMRAYVNEGAIVVAPFSSQCSAVGLGPCSQNATVLSGLSHQILEMNVGVMGISSQLLPATSAQAQALVAEVPPPRVDSSNKPPKTGDAKDLYSDTVASRAVNTTLANSETIKPVGPPSTPVPDPTTPVVTTPDPTTPVVTTPDPTTPVVTAPDPTPAPLPAPDFTPAVAQTVAALTASSNQLVWGRYSNSTLGNERITVLHDFNNLTVQKDSQITVGNNQYGLFRSEPAGQTFKTGLGVLAFNLSAAQVQFSSGGKADLMQVNGGQLSLDFSQSKFSTSLQLSHAATGDITFADSGQILFGSGGVFFSNGDTQSMAGAVSLDGKQAGYLFQKTLTNGVVQGLTLWSQKP